MAGRLTGKIRPKLKFQLNSLKSVNMQKTPSERPKPLIPEQEATNPNATLNEILNSSGILAQRLMNILQTMDGVYLSPQIFTEGRLPRELRDEKVFVNSEYGNKFGIEIRRDGKITNDLTHFTIFLRPQDYDTCNIFSGIEEGLSKEWEQKHNSNPQISGEHICSYLKTMGSKGTDIITIKLLFARHANPTIQSSQAHTPIAIQVFISLRDNSIIKFDPLIKHNGTIEARGPYSRIVYKRILEKLASAINVEEIIKISAYMKYTLRKQQILPTNDDNLDTEDEKSSEVDPKDLN